AFYLEFDDERSGGFEPLRFVPKGKEVVLGIITSKKPELEDKEELKQRIKEAAKYVDLENLALSTQCGFASTEEGNKLTEEDQEAKIKLVIETAKEVWS
ncbi:5-methyltetrahydropteroyltriglutamate--homocysteine methyltransferase, partial [Lactobacillus salivarius]|nr:5-methyltetrahydropteroyltriglutamate--homocysteine methyltransferase [Ligilactobacillus salivarius]